MAAPTFANAESAGSVRGKLNAILTTLAPVVDIASLDIPDEVEAIRSAGYATAGDGGRATYRRVISQPSHLGRFQSADGGWWELAETEINVKMFGAKGDGVTDDAAAIQAAINLGVTSVFFPEGTYLCNTGVAIRGNLRLYGVGQKSRLKKSATLVAGYYNRSVFYAPDLGAVENLEIDHLAFISDYAAAQSDSALLNFDVGSNQYKNISIHDNYFSTGDYASPCIQVSQALAGRMDGLFIRNNAFRDCKYVAVALTNNVGDTVVRNTNLQITGNIFYNVLGFCVSIAGGSASVIVNANSFGGANGYGVEFAGSIQGGSISDNVFSGSFSQIMALSANPAFGSSTDIVVANNTTQGSVTGSWTLQGVASLIMTGNRFNTTGQLIFSGVTLGITAFVSNNWVNQAIGAINGAAVTLLNNYVSATPPIGDESKVYTVDLTGGDTTSTAVIDPGSQTSWRALAVRVRVAQVAGGGGGGAYAESVIVFRYLNSTTSQQISKTDIVTSAGLVISVAYGTRNATITATSTTADVRQYWTFDVMGQTANPSITVAA